MFKFSYLYELVLTDVLFIYKLHDNNEMNIYNLCRLHLSKAADDINDEINHLNV